MARVSLSAVVCFAVLLAACGRPDPGFDSSSLVRAIPVALVPDDPAIVTNVQCPDLATSAATTISCTAELDGHDVVVIAVIGADAAVAVSIDQVLLDLAGVAQAAEARLDTDLGLRSTVDCPGSVAVSVAGDTIRCTATDPIGVERDLVVTILDGNGNWSLDLAP